MFLDRSARSFYAETKGKIMKPCIFMLFVLSAGFMCAQSRLLPKNEAPLPVPGESVLVITNQARADSVLIYVDGIRKAHLLAGETLSLAVSDGRRTVKAVQLRWNSKTNTWEEKNADSKKINCSAQLIALEVTTRPGIKIAGRSPVNYGGKDAAEAAAKTARAVSDAAFAEMPPED
jgi:hypothetical protein